MEKRQVIIISLLALAIVLSAASVMMNVAIINGVNINEAPAQPSNGQLSLEVLPTNQNTGDRENGLG